MSPDRPTETHALFEHDRVAAGYASARPYLHPQVFAQARELAGLAGRARRALDVGCGTGLSSRALLDLAHEVVGIDASLPMAASREPRPRGALRGLGRGGAALP